MHDEILDIFPQLIPWEEALSIAISMTGTYEEGEDNCRRLQESEIANMQFVSIANE